MTSPNNARDLTLTAADGYRLSATRYPAQGATRGHLVMAGATRVPQGFYRCFAEFAASHGYSVMTLDYRGIGRSRAASLKGFRMDYLDWGRQDYPAKRHSVRPSVHSIANAGRAGAGFPMIADSTSKETTMPSQNILTLGLRPIVMAAAVLACAIPATSALASPLDWVAGDKVQGSGSIKKQTRQLAHFTGVSLSLPASTELRIGNTESITIETDDNLLPLIETVIENGTLKIRPAKRNTNLQTRTMKIVVVAKNVERLSLGGSGAIESDALRGNKLQFDLGGSGSIRLKGMESEAVAISVGGSGNFKSGPGKAASLSVSIGGSGDVDVGQVQVGDASVSVAGSGTAVVWANTGLSVTIAGSGDVNYYGDPKVSRSVIGSGGTKRLGGAPR